MSWEYEELEKPFFVLLLRINEEVLCLCVSNFVTMFFYELRIILKKTERKFPLSI